MKYREYFRYWMNSFSEKNQKNSSFAFEVLIAFNFSTLKLIIFVYYHKTFDEIFEMIRNEFWDFKDEDHGKEKEVLFVRNSRKMKKMLGRFLAIFPVIAIMFLLKPIFNHSLPLPNGMIGNLCWYFSQAKIFDQKGSKKAEIWDQNQAQMIAFWAQH